jgi:hypothetical protein
MKRHLATDAGTSSCGRGKVITENVNHVTCDLCRAKPVYIKAKIILDAMRKAEFEAQVPRTRIEPWHQDRKQMVCKSCGNDTFREGDRTCYGHYANYYCAACGGCESRLTETGMSF